VAKADGSPDQSGVQVIARVGQILRMLSQAPQGRSLAEIAGEVGLPRSTVHRLVKALEREHFVVPASSSAGFRLGPGLLELASATREWLVAGAHADLVSLSDRVEETVDLAVLTGRWVTFIDQVAPPQRLQAVSAVGLSFALHSTANGKAILAELEDSAISALLPPRLERFTPNTITSRATLLEELQTVRETRLAWDREENDLGICAVGTVVPNPFGILTAVSIPVPVSRFTGHERQLGDALLAARQKIEATLSA
jgi:DNA-binding IclR family transcriptional regulator